MTVPASRIDALERVVGGLNIPNEHIIDLMELLNDARVRDAGVGRDVDPVPMILTCPACCARHVDEGEFATKRHHTHACQECGLVWRPAKVDTFGVRFLPGYKSAQSESVPAVGDADRVVAFLRSHAHHHALAGHSDIAHELREKADGIARGDHRK